MFINILYPTFCLDGDNDCGNDLFFICAHVHSIPNYYTSNILGDMSDEHEDICGVTTTAPTTTAPACLPDQFQCANGRCIPIRWR